MGGLRQIDPDDAIKRAEEKQEQEHERVAYESGKARHKSNQEQPDKPGGPGDDHYDRMSDREKEAYKKGHRGD